MTTVGTIMSASVTSDYKVTLPEAVGENSDSDDLVMECAGLSRRAHVQPRTRPWRADSSGTEHGRPQLVATTSGYLHPRPGDSSARFLAVTSKTAATVPVQQTKATG